MNKKTMNKSKVLIAILFTIFPQVMAIGVPLNELTEEEIRQEIQDELKKSQIKDSLWEKASSAFTAAKQTVPLLPFYAKKCLNPYILLGFANHYFEEKMKRMEKPSYEGLLSSMLSQTAKLLGKPMFEEFKNLFAQGRMDKGVEDRFQQVLEDLSTYGSAGSDDVGQMTDFQGMELDLNIAPEYCT